LILSDINMPGMSGLEFLPKAKAARPDVPFQGERPSGPAFIIWSIPTKRTLADAAGKAGDADNSPIGAALTARSMLSTISRHQSHWRRHGAVGPLRHLSNRPVSLTLAGEAARTTWARRALEGARPSCRLSGLRRPAPVSPVFAGCHVPSDRLQRMGESGAAAASARLGRWLPQLWGVGSR